MPNLIKKCAIFFLENISICTLSTDLVKNTELREKSNRKVPYHMGNSNNKTHKKRMDKNCHVPDLVQAFSNVENGGLNLNLSL